MSEKIVARSTVYQHGKTQIPRDIRKHLDLDDSDNINYVQTEDGRIYITKGEKLEKHRRLGKY